MNTDRQSVHTIRTTGELISAVPALLGYLPDESLIAVAFRDNQFLLVARAHLTELTGPAAPWAFIGAIAEHCVDVIHLIVVSNRQPDHGAPPHQDLVDAVRDAAQAAGIHLAHPAWTPAMDTDTPWCCYDCDRAGTLTDPHLCDLALTAVVRGTVIHPTRDGIADHLTLAEDDHVLAARARRITDTLADHTTEPIVPIGRGYHQVRTAIEATHRGLPPRSDQQIVELAAALCHPRTRDRCLGFSLCSRNDAAELLWTALVRSTPAPYRAEPAALLAVAAYLRGAGALANAALDIALRANPRHRLADLLRRALACAMSPAELADMLTESITHA